MVIPTQVYLGSAVNLHAGIHLHACLSEQKYQLHLFSNKHLRMYPVSNACRPNALFFKHEAAGGLITMIHTVCFTSFMHVPNLCLRIALNEE